MYIKNRYGQVMLHNYQVQIKDEERRGYIISVYLWPSQLPFCEKVIDSYSEMSFKTVNGGLSEGFKGSSILFLILSNPGIKNFIW